MEEGVVERLSEEVVEISAIQDYRNAYKKHFCNLARRIKILSPLFEELRDAEGPLSPEASGALKALAEAMKSSRELLRFGSEGSKICLVLEGDKILKRFQEITTQLEHALGEIPFDKLDISDEVREQVELVHAQFKRAKERIEMPDTELYTDLLSTYHNRNSDTDDAILKRLAEKLHLMTVSDLTQESLALHEMIRANNGADPGENIEKMSMLLKKIKDYVQTQNLEMGVLSNAKGLNLPPKPAIIPDDFRCPISLELMKDPVIVATGQTYERESIEKWLEVGHDTCPKTLLRLSNKSRTPNYVLRSLIAQWCEANGLEPPKRPTNTPYNKSILSGTPGELAKIDTLLRQLSSPNTEDQRAAAGQLRLLAKCSAENRICIAEVGAIPVLVSLLPTLDAGTQEHAVTALLNLSICEENKRSIILSGAVPGIVHVLKKGSMEARENAAAALFSLSVVDENKVIIGTSSGAIPALALLLKEGTQRGKKDAATALFNLCIYQGNKGKAVRAGVIPTLMELLTDPTSGMVDEALAVLAILASHPEGKAAIKPAEAVPVLVDLITGGSSRSKENAAAILVHLFGGEQQYEHLAMAQGCGALVPLLDLAENGTDRGKRKATQLIERLNSFMEQQAAAQTSLPTENSSSPTAPTTVNE